MMMKISPECLLAGSSKLQDHREGSCVITCVISVGVKCTNQTVNDGVAYSKI